jgi:hypothetical protein
LYGYTTRCSKHLTEAEVNTTTILLAILAVLMVLYVLRRRARLNRELRED